MTMRVQVTNLGPDCYAAVLESKQCGQTILKMGESHETYVFPGAELLISEVDVKPTIPAGA